MFVSCLSFFAYVTNINQSKLFVKPFAKKDLSTDRTLYGVSILDCQQISQSILTALILNKLSILSIAMSA